MRAKLHLMQIHFRTKDMPKYHCWRQQQPVLLCNSSFAGIGFLSLVVTCMILVDGISKHLGETRKGGQFHLKDSGMVSMNILKSKFHKCFTDKNWLVWLICTRSRILVSSDLQSGIAGDCIQQCILLLWLTDLWILKMLEEDNGMWLVSCNCPYLIFVRCSKKLLMGRRGWHEDTMPKLFGEFIILP